MNQMRLGAAALLCALLFVVSDGKSIEVKDNIVAKKKTKDESKSIDVLLQEILNETEASGKAQPLEPDVMRVELDMLYVLPNGTQVKGMDSYKAIRGERFRWTYKTLPYAFQQHAFSAAEQRMIRASMDIWSHYTCVKFTPRSNQQKYVYIVNGAGCSSYVGMQAFSGQQLTLAPACRITSIVLHELGHAIGFQHEHCRPDRDSYVRVFLQNVHHNMRFNFDKHSTQNIDDRGVRYDYKSIMHYGQTAFSMNGQRTIQTLDPNFQRLIGTYQTLSFSDVMLANLIYSCNEDCPVKLECKGGYQAKDCQCWCPSGSDSVPAKPCDGTVPSTTPQPDDCVDHHQHCAFWASQGYCNHPHHREYMKVYCPKSCGYC